MREVTIRIAWVDQSDAFYRNLVAAVARQLAIREAALFSPMHRPSVQFCSAYGQSHPWARSGELVSVRVSLDHFPGRVPEVTNVSVTDSTVGGDPQPPPDPMSLVEAFDVIHTVPPVSLRSDLIRGGGITVIGGRFDVYARFRKDPTNEYRKLEFRQYIRGETKVNGVPQPMIYILRKGGGTRPIDYPLYLEDGDVELGSNGFYGRRSNAVAENDYYYSRDANGAETRDMLGGNYYINYDIFGLRLRPGQLLQIRNQEICINLEFKVQIAVCNSPGGEPVAFHPTAWRKFSKVGSVTVH